MWCDITCLLTWEETCHLSWKHAHSCHETKIRWLCLGDVQWRTVVWHCKLSRLHYIHFYFLDSKIYWCMILGLWRILYPDLSLRMQSLSQNISNSEKHVVCNFSAKLVQTTKMSPNIRTDIPTWFTQISWHLSIQIGFLLCIIVFDERTFGASRKPNKSFTNSIWNVSESWFAQ